MAQDYDYMDGGEGQMFHDFYNNYEEGEAEYECPFCQNVFRVDGDDRYVECPYCGETLDTEELDDQV